MLYTKANIYSLCVQKSGPSCSAVWKRQVSFYLSTAPRKVGTKQASVTVTSAKSCTSVGARDERIFGCLKTICNALFEQLVWTIINC